MLPDTARVLFTHALLDSERENRTRLRQFKEVGLILRSREIPVIPLKGLDLSLRVYRKTPFRLMFDIDLLLPEERLNDAVDCLTEHGFSLKKLLNRNRWHNRFCFSRNESLIQTPCGRVCFEKNGLDVDLHWNPKHKIGGQNVPMDIRAVWAHKLPCPDLGKNVFLASRADAVWHLLLHHTGEMYAPRFVHLLDLFAAMNALNPDEKKRVRLRLDALEPPSAFKIQTLLNDVDAFTRRQPPSFFLFRGAPGLYRPEPMWDGGPPIRQRSLSEKMIYFSGYLLPDPEYYAGKAKGAAMYLEHWKSLIHRCGEIVGEKTRQRI